MSDIDLINSDEDFAEFVRSLDEIKKQIDCPICLESFNQNHPILVKSCCGHYYCQPCYDRINVCAMCRKNLNKHNKIIQHNNIYPNNQNPNQEIIQENIHIHTINYNVLRIMAGFGGIAYFT
jgi:hypothetical protein